MEATTYILNSLREVSHAFSSADEFEGFVYQFGWDLEIDDEFKKVETIQELTQLIKELVNKIDDFVGSSLIQN